MGGDKKRLGYLKQRILGGRADDSGRQGTTINEDEEEVCVGNELLLVTHITFKIYFFAIDVVLYGSCLLILRFSSLDCLFFDVLYTVHRTTGHYIFSKCFCRGPIVVPSMRTLDLSFIGNWR